MASLIVAPSPARGDVLLTPSHDGYLGTWLVAGPIPKTLAATLDASAAEPKAGAGVPTAPWLRFRLVNSASSIDLARELGIQKASTGSALLGGILEVPSEASGWLLISVDGGIEVYLDGQSVLRRDLERVRAGAWDIVPLKLAAGAHRLVMALHRRGIAWSFDARILGKRDLLPPPDLSLRLIGVEPSQAATLQSSLLRVSAKVLASEHGLVPELRVNYPRGIVRDSPTDVAVLAHTRPGRKLFEVKLGSLLVGARGAHALHAELPRLDAQAIPAANPAKLELVTRVGSARATSSLAVSRRIVTGWARAQKVFEQLAGDQRGVFENPELIQATVKHRLRTCAEAASAGLVPRLAGELAELEKLLSLLEQQRDPMRDPGLVLLAHTSALDARPQPFLVHVPASYPKDSGRRYPLVVLLHGYNGSPSGVMQAFLDRASSLPHPRVDGFVVAPHAFGNSFYAGAGEKEVLSVLDLMLENYPIDPERVALSGVSMGGTGAGQIALRYTDRFARAAPLAGYHSYFLRHDVAGRRTRPWETTLLEHWSTVSWADNGRALPLYVAHGRRDVPLQNSRVLIDRYLELGYPLQQEWPDIGHPVWEVSYDGARLWPWLTEKPRQPTPQRVTLGTDQLRYGRKDWVRIMALEPGRFGRLDVLRTSSDRVEVDAEYVLGFELLRERSQLASDRSIEVRIGQSLVKLEPNRPLELHRTSGGWQAGNLGRRGWFKRSGLEGPIYDVYLEPLTIVYGARDPATARANREVAEALARIDVGSDVAYDIIADHALSDATARDRSLVLVGNPRDHRVLAKIGPRLPIRIDGEAIVAHDRRFEGAEVGVIFIHPNPDHPSRYVLVVQAPSPAGIWRALSLPKLLPDFVIYDSELSAAAGQKVLGSASVLGAGFFGNDWSVPEDIADPLRIR